MMNELRAISLQRHDGHDLWPCALRDRHDERDHEVCDLCDDYSLLCDEHDAK